MPVFPPCLFTAEHNLYTRLLFNFYYILRVRYIGTGILNRSYKKKLIRTSNVGQPEFYLQKCPPNNKLKSCLDLKYKLCSSAPASRVIVFMFIVRIK